MTAKEPKERRESPSSIPLSIGWREGGWRPGEGQIRVHSCPSVVACFASLLLCAFALNLPATEVARVGETVITTETVRETMARQGYNLYDSASVNKALDDAVRFELLAAEAKRLGLDKDADLQRRIKELLVDRLLREKASLLQPEPAFAEAELRAYYESHTNDFRRPTVVRGSVLTIYLREGQEEAARQKAADALRAWKSGEAVATVLRKYSDDPSERVAGDAGSAFIEGQSSRRYPQVVADAMFGLQLRGQVAAPVETPRAIYLIGLAERINGAPEPFEKVKRDIQRLLGQQVREKAYAAYCESLKKQFPVSVNDEELKKIVQQLNADARPPVGPGGAP